MNDINEVISEAIKESKYVQISYRNSMKEKTVFWFGVNDVSLSKKILFGDIFNYFKGLDVKQNATIYFDRIESAEIVDETDHPTPKKLIEKIERNLDRLSWLKFHDHKDECILDYFADCYKLDNDPKIENYEYIKGLDRDYLVTSNKPIKLNSEQFSIIIERILKVRDKNRNKRNIFTLCINTLAIQFNRNVYVIAYNDLRVNLVEKTIVMTKRSKINQNMLVDGRKISLQTFLDVPLNEFIKNFNSEKDRYISLIRENLKSNQPNYFLDTTPKLFERIVPISNNIDPAVRSIKLMREENKLEPPIKALLKIDFKRVNKKIERTIVSYNKKINISQLSAVYNAMMSPITYVEGPPGTGKTQTILNVILSAFANRETCLICSNNNKPLDDIFKSFNFVVPNSSFTASEKIIFPIIRLGNWDENIKACSRIIECYNYVRKFPEGKVNDSLKILDEVKKEYNKMGKLIDLYESQNHNEEQIKKYQNIKDQFSDLNSESMKQLNDYCNIKIEENRKNLNKYARITDEIAQRYTISGKDDRTFMRFLKMHSLEKLQKLKQPRYRDLIQICLLENIDERGKRLKQYLQKGDNFKKFLDAFPFIISTNASAINLGENVSSFDLTIMDEAGQCNSAPAISAIVRGKRLMLVGDLKQLPHITNLENSVNEKLMEHYNVPDDYNYITNSILAVMKNVDKRSKKILLNYHYRCTQNIIKFSNMRYYNGKLIPRNPNKGELIYSNIKSNNLYAGKRNTSLEEVVNIVNYIKKNKLEDIGVITPFKNQAASIKEALERLGITSVNVGTVSSFQGGEKQTIIFSTAITPKTGKKTFEWLKNNKELINVANTRAKKKLVVYVDNDVLKKLNKGENSDINALVEFVKSNGKTIVPAKIDIPRFGLSNDSENERELFKILQVFINDGRKLDIKRNVPMRRVIKARPKKYLDYYYNAEYDFVVYDQTKKQPILVIELNGPEHIFNPKAIENDRKKIQLTKDANLPLCIISNEDIFDYDIVKELINKQLNVETQEKLF